MQICDERGEIYRNWLIVLINLENTFFYELHSPEGYINRNLMPFGTPQAALESGKKDIDGVIAIFETADSLREDYEQINAVAESASNGGEKR